MVRRFIDVLFSVTGLIILFFPLILILFLIWRQDRHLPFYIADRVGQGGKSFRMVKVRSMIVNADKSGGESTSADDVRITPLGHFIRRWKIDELGQLWNVLIGQMSLVGPRPNTISEVATYSDEERGLLSVRPGITDFSSIVFSDEGEILQGSADPDRDYNRLIRPWKSQLGLLYARNATPLLNLQLIWLTVVAIFDKRKALDKLQPVLAHCQCDPTVAEAAKRKAPSQTFGLPPVDPCVR